MGLLVNGQWQDKWYDTDANGGEFQREDAGFRHWIGEPVGELPQSAQILSFPAEANRYQLYVSLACPWAHRTLIFRELKGLRALIPVAMVDPEMLQHGWTFSDKFPGNKDPLHKCQYLHQLYIRAKPDYTGRVTVPVLWDRETQTIVSNESAEIIRMFNSAFDALTGNRLDFYPQALRSEIDAINAKVYANVNNGVYKAGFATSQQAYEKAFSALFATLDELEALLSRQRYLVGTRLTEADWRLFTTLVRFDAVYVGHFKCNRNRIADMPNLQNYMRELYQIPGISETVNLAHIKTHYYYSHDNINPTRIVPAGPTLSLAAPHDRARFPAAD